MVAAAKGGSCLEMWQPPRQIMATASTDRGNGRDMPVDPPTADLFGSGEKAARPAEEHRGNLLDLRIRYRYR